jgi:protein-disulfide isomerase/uncharacterized membrane protein
MRARVRASRRQSTYAAVVTLGVVASAYVTYGHYVVLRNPLYFPWCDAGARVACTPVYVSRFGYVFGAPAGVLLLVLFVVCAALRAPWQIDDTPFRASLVFSASIAGVAIGIYQTYGSAVLLHLVCIPCVAVHAASFALFTIAAPDATMPATHVIAGLWRRARSGVAPLASGAVAVAVLYGMVLFFPERRPTLGASAAAADSGDRVVSREALTRWYLAQQGSREPRLSAPHGVVLVKFNDFQCPPCRQAFFDYRAAIAQLRERFGAAFTFTNIDFPLDRKCNPFVSASIHPIACEAAVAVRLAGRMGKAAPLEEWLFSHQADLSAPAAVWNGLESSAQMRDGAARYGELVSALDEDVQLAHRLGVDATPTFFLNGVRLGSGMSPAELAVLVDAAASRAGVGRTEN